MTSDRSAVDAAPRLRNTPIRPREWEELLNRDDVTSVSLEDNELALVPRNGQLCLYFAFAGAAWAGAFSLGLLSSSRCAAVSTSASIDF